jgi:hypothetical protein
MFHSRAWQSIRDGMDAALSYSVRERGPFMFRRILLAFMFLSAFGAASMISPDNAEARWGRRSYYRSSPSFYWGRPYRYYERGPYYRRAYYAPRYYYGPRYYYRTRYYGWPDDYYYYGPRRGVYFRYGF